MSSRCPHQNCGCAPAPEHAPFCGPYCANASHDEPRGEAVACACEHEACARSQETGRSRPGPDTSVGPP